MSQIEILMSACIDAEYGFSKDSSMPWCIDDEYENFKNLLSSYPEGNASVVLGRVTWEKDGLPEGFQSRYAKVLVISTSVEKEYDNVIYIKSIAEAIEHLHKYLIEIKNVYPHRLFILGGENIYKESFQLNIVDKLVMSRLPKSYSCTQFLTWLPNELSEKMVLIDTIQHKEFLVEIYQKIKSFEYSCESVTEGHPDKVCDIISDSIVDAYIQQDPWSKVACEVMAYENMIVLCGYSLSDAVINEDAIVREVLKDLGFDDDSKGIDYRTVPISVNIHKSPSPSVKSLALMPADDQAVLYGYATNETPEMMPLPHYYAAKLTLRLSFLRRCASSNNTCSLSDTETKLAYMLRPAGKSQVTAAYDVIGKVKRNIKISVVVLEAQHNPGVDLDELRHLLDICVIKQVIPSELLSPNMKLYINGDGEYTHGGFRGGGLTGRKQNIDTYGSIVRMGGGAFSGKDYRKMDRSGAYAARWIAKSLVSANLCDRCTIGLAYAIGHAQPVMITIDTEFTASSKGYSDSQLAYIVSKNFNLSTGGIVESLNLQKPIFKQTAAGGHFGREGFPWEEPKELKYIK